MLEEWLGRRCQVPADQMAAAINAQEEAFDALMNTVVNGVTRRQRLLDPKERAAVRRIVREAILAG